MSIEDLERAGDLCLPDRPIGQVVFAHGSSHRDTGTRLVCDLLQHAGFATLSVDLLSFGDHDRYSDGFDIAVLSRRLTAITRWLVEQDLIADPVVGYLGTGLGSATALAAAAEFSAVAAVVCCGGRPDLAGPSLLGVSAPTLLISAGRDPAAVVMAQRAAETMICRPVLTTVPFATQPFDEPGALEKTADLAQDWFTTHLGAPAPAGAEHS